MYPVPSDVKSLRKTNIRSIYEQKYHKFPLINNKFVSLHREVQRCIAVTKSSLVVLYRLLTGMARYYDITNWSEKPFFNTKGTRNKCVVTNPENNKDYYFKTSMIKEGKNYKPEFWSEIIASEVGRFLGFNVLEYNIAKHGNDVGCLSQSMNSDEESLTEGISLLTGYDNTYNPNDKTSYSAYTFDFIRKALEYFQWGEYVDDIIKIVIFDSLIGNSDRHQENWGFVTTLNPVAKDTNKTLISKVTFLLKKRKKDIKKIEINIEIAPMQGRFAPIYDSGCCLAREKSDEDVTKLLRDSLMFDSYINRGKSEIRWGEKGEKLNHFALIKEIRKEYKQIVDDEIRRVIEAFNTNKIREIIFNIDNALPDELKTSYALSEERKELIYRLINNRFNRLKEILL